MTIPAADQRLQTGDHVMIAAASEEVAAVVGHLDGDVERIRDVVVFGGGKIGYFVARRLLDEGFDVKLMEQDAQRSQWLAEHLEHGLVLHEEDLSEEVLLTHGVDRAGAFVACADDDRTNLLATLFAKRLGAGMCPAVVSRAQYVPGRVFSEDVRRTVLGLFLLWIAVWALATVSLTAAGLDLISAAAGAAAALNLAGAGLNQLGALENFEALPQGGRWITTGLMLVGRLEVFTVLALLTPAFWRRHWA